MFRFLRRLFLVVFLLLIAGLTYALWPRTGDLRGFDVEAVARLETGMWRDYYAKDYKSLAQRLYTMYRDIYHFSPADSAQLAYNAGQAAKVFQPTGSRAEAQVALPFLVRYYTLLRDKSGETFDVEKAAKLELDWWQLRRENATPQQYGEVVAEVAEVVFHAQNEHVSKSGVQRAVMMRYRDDRRNGGMKEEDWAHIEKHLIEAYRELKTGVSRTPAA